jgi:hypothetical protein
MAEKPLQDYWNASFEALYDACFYELASDRIIERWYWIDLAVSILTALTILGSAASGWALWTRPDGKLVWGCFTALSFGLVIFHKALAVPSRIRKEGERRQLFSQLRAELQNFRGSLPRGVDALKANKRFALLMERLRSSISQTPQDIVFTPAAQRAVQVLVDEKLKRFING